MEYEFITPGTVLFCCHEGIGQKPDIPPPPPPPEFILSFHTVSIGGVLGEVISVPPTPTTYGSLAGSFTDRELMPSTCWKFPHWVPFQSIAPPPLVTPIQKVVVGQDRLVANIVPPSNPIPVAVGDCHDVPFHWIAYRLLFPPKTLHDVVVAQDSAVRNSEPSTVVVEDAQLEEAHSIPSPAESTAQQGPDAPGAQDRDVATPVVSPRVTGVLQEEPLQETP